MRNRLRFTLVAALIIAVLLACRPAEAQFTGPIGPSNGEVVGILIAMIAVTAAITVGVVYAIRHQPSLRGCAISGPGGLTLENESDHQSFSLNGETTGIKPGDRVKVQGKKQKANGTVRGFTVLKVKHDYGACPVRL